MNITIRNLQDATFRKFKARAAEENLKLGDALTQAMDLWIKRVEKKPRSKLSDLPTFDLGPGSEKLSTEIDKILYG